MGKKSTPLNQIPRPPATADMMNSEFASDDDSTIKDLLAKLNNNSPGQVEQQHQQQQQQPILNDHPTLHPHLPQLQPMHQSQQFNHINPQQQNGFAEHMDAIKYNEEELSESWLDAFSKRYMGDVQLVIVFFIVIVAINVFPIQSLVSKYIFASDLIPYSDVLMRALLGTMIMYISVLLLYTRK